MDAIDEDSMESDGGLGSGGRERKSLTGFDLEIAVYSNICC